MAIIQCVGGWYAVDFSQEYHGEWRGPYPTEKAARTEDGSPEILQPVATEENT